MKTFPNNKTVSEMIKIASTQKSFEEISNSKSDGIRDNGRRMSSEAPTALINPLRIQPEKAEGEAKAHAE